jgi:hypothetical protein
MTSLVDYILSLFRSEDAAQSFVAAPGQAMTNAGLINVSPAEVSQVAASAVPGLALPFDDPIGGLQQAVASQYGYAVPTSDPGLVSDYFAQDPGYFAQDPGYYAQDPGPVFDAASPIIDAGLIAGDAGVGWPQVSTPDWQAASIRDSRSRPDSASSLGLSVPDRASSPVSWEALLAWRSSSRPVVSALDSVSVLRAVWGLDSAYKPDLALSWVQG